MNPIRVLRSCLLLSVALAAFVNKAHGQDQTSPDAQRGLSSTASYFSGDIDKINLYNGNLFLDLSLIAPPARELPTGIRLRYNSQKWIPWFYESYPSGRYMGGWQADSPGFEFELPFPDLIDCNSGVGTWAYWAVWADGSGVTHEFVNPGVEGGNCDYTLPAAAILHSLSDSRVLMKVVQAGEPAIIDYIQLPDGTVVRPFNTSADITSVNGSYAAYSNDGDLRHVSITDALGRQYGWHSGSAGFCYKDSDGDYQVHEPHFSTHSVYNPIINATETYGPSLLDDIELSNGRSYAFEYDHVQGFLTKVTLPSGAYIRYVYAGGNESTSAADDYVAERYVSADGTTENEKLWTYERNSGFGTRIITVKSPEAQGGSPLMGPVKHYFNDFGLEEKVEWYAPDGTTLIKTVTTGWQQGEGAGTGGQPINPKTVIVTTAMDGLKQTVESAYDENGNVDTITESDWYEGEPETIPYIRRTDNRYASLTGQIADFYRVDLVEVQKNTGSGYETIAKTQFTLNAGGNPTTITRYVNETTTVTETRAYNGPHVISITDASNNTTGISYTDNYRSGSYSGSQTHGFPTSITNAAGHVTTFEYDYNTGLVTKVTDARGQDVAMTYDSMNRTLQVTEEAGRQITYTYNDDPMSPLSVLEEVLVASGIKRKTETIFDKLYRPVQTIRHDPADNVIVETQYDGNGRVKQVSVPRRSGSAVWTTVEYDALGREKTITNPDDSERQFAYTANTVTATDEAGNQKRQFFNGIGQLVRVDEPDPGETTPSLDVPLSTLYTYNAAGSLLTVCQHANSEGNCASGAQERSFTVNWLGQVTAETHPESGTTSYTYYNNGLLHTRSDLRIVTGSTHVTATYAYDAIGRPTSISYNDTTPAVTYVYDQGTNNQGLLTSITDGAGSVTMTYTAAGLLASETRQFTDVLQPVTSSYEYDYDGRLTQVTYPTGRVVKQDFAASSGVGVNRLDTLAMKHNSEASSWTTLLSGIADNAAGQVTARSIGALTETREFNVRHQLTEIEAKDGSTSRMKLNYGYGTTDNTGRIQARTNADDISSQHSAVYAYDALGRLKGVTHAAETPSWSVTWTYDAHGNRKGQARTGTPTGDLPAFSNLVYGNNQNPNYEYDLAGNVTEMPFGTGTVAITWDAENRMRAFGGVASYVYDGFGRKVKSTVDGVSTYYVYGLTGLMSEFLTLNTGATVAADNDTVRFVIPEHNGTGVLIADDMGDPVEENRRLPFGEAFGAENSNSTNDQKFTTYDRDSATGLDYAMARWYASREGRFMSPDPGHVGADPKSPQSWNAYVYSRNEPISRIDPSGLTDYFYNASAQLLWSENDGFFHNLFHSDTHTLIANDGTPYRLAEKLDDLSDGKEYMIFTEEEATATVEQWWDERINEDRFNFPFGINNVYHHAGQDQRLDFKTGRDQHSLYQMDDGKLHSLDFFGNYAWGFLMAGYGYPRDISHLGAGIAQIMDRFNLGSTHSIGMCLFDQCRDYHAVELGYEKWRQVGKTGDTGLARVSRHFTHRSK